MSQDMPVTPDPQENLQGLPDAGADIGAADIAAADIAAADVGAADVGAADIGAADVAAADIAAADLESMVGLDPVGGAEHARVVAEREEYLDALRRLQADFENYRKRVQRDSDAAADKAGEKLVNRLLPVLDTFELALAHESDPDASPMARMHDSLLSALEGEGLERVSPLGEPFDPNSAEAVMHEEGDGGEPVVSEVLRAGYIWKGRVVRAAMVKVRG
jgi:molecular chaperone GrpE